MRLILYIAIALILWRIIRAYAGRSAPSKPTVEGRPTREQVDRAAPPIDYGRVRDAEFREGGWGEEAERRAGGEARGRAGDGERGGR